MHNPGNFELTEPIAYPQKCGPLTVLSPPAGAQLGLGEFVLTNRSGGAANVGLAWKIPNGLWKAGQIIVANTPDYSDDTTDAQSAATGDFPLFTTTANDGFLVQSPVKFNVIGMTVSTALIGAPTIVYEYYDGTAMVTLTTIEAEVVFATGDKFTVFQSPVDWAKGSTAAVGADSDKYCIQARASVAPTTAPIASILWLGQLINFFPSLGNNAAQDFEVQGEIVIQAAASVMPYFGTANAANSVQLHWRRLGHIP